MKKCLVFASHIYDVNNEYEIDMFKYKIESVNKYVDKIIVVYSSNYDLNIENYNYDNIQIMKVDNVGYDFNKYRIGLLSITDLYDRYIVMNDSIFFSRDIKDIFDFIDLNESEFIGLCNSSTMKYHYQSFFWVMNENIKYKFIDYHSQHKNENDVNSLITNIEVNFSNEIINKYESSCIFDYIEKNVNNKYLGSCGCFSIKYSLYVLETKFPVVKVKNMDVFMCDEMMIKYKESKMKNLYEFKKNVNFIPRSFSWELYKKNNKFSNTTTENECLNHFKYSIHSIKYSDECKEYLNKDIYMSIKYFKNVDLLSILEKRYDLSLTT